MSNLTDGKRLSFEFYPPKTEAGKTKLAGCWQELNAANPEFFSVTYGAGGSTRDNTRGIVTGINNDGIAVAPHLSFGGDNEETMLQLLSDYRDQGIKRIVALRGDMPSGMGGMDQLVYANELVAFIRKHFGDHFHLEVAAYPEIHPQANSWAVDIAYLKGKFDAGANSGITQYFFNADAYFFFLEDCQKAGITAPIYPGIMPITNIRNLARFSSNCGADIPRWIMKRFEGMEDNIEAVTEIGIEIVSRMCETLLAGGAPGIHFYTMNTTNPTLKIANNLGW